MHQVMVDIVLDAIIALYTTEKNFYQQYLKLEPDVWKAWKAGTGSLPAEEMQKIKGLFTDYEWMLVQKILRQTLLFPEKRNYAVSEYKRLKTMIAKKWLQNGGGIVELITQRESSSVEETQNQRASINLRISMCYGEWGYDDILEFQLPAMLQQQIEAAQINLLEWVNQNLTDAYVSEMNEE